MFKSGGYNVYPAEVEQVVSAHEDVTAAAVVSAADPLWGEVGVAFVVPQPGRSIRTDELRAYARRRLANYKVPKRFEVVGELPQLPNGKVDRQALRALADYEGTGAPNVS
jgi:fatty-acyl-CoA synthase